MVAFGENASLGFQFRCVLCKEAVLETTTPGRLGFLQTVWLFKGQLFVVACRGAEEDDYADCWRICERGASLGFCMCAGDEVTQVAKPRCKPVAHVVEP